MKGLLVAILSGVLCACYAIAVSYGGTVTEIATTQHGNPGWRAAFVVTALILWGGSLSACGYCVYKLCRNKTWGSLARPGIGKVLLIALAMALLHDAAILLFAVGASKLGPLGVAVEIDASQPLEIGRGVYRSLSSAATLQSDESRGIDRITLQNIHSIKDLDIFGSELMIKSELAKFRKDLKKIETQDRLERYLAAHRARMNARATKRGVVLD